MKRILYRNLAVLSLHQTEEFAEQNINLLDDQRSHDNSTNVISMSFLHWKFLGWEIDLSLTLNSMVMQRQLIIQQNVQKSTKPYSLVCSLGGVGEWEERT